MKAPEELLYDSEASLRLVDHAIEELSTSGAELDREARGFLDHVMAQPGGFAELSRTLLRAYAETVGIVVRIRESCGMVDSAGVDKLQQMHGRIREVSSATETAATDILDGLSRAVNVIDQLDTPDALPDAERHRMIASVKEELSGVMNHLQFQDITAQQLGHIASLLADMRRRINQIVTIFSAPTVQFARDDVPAGSFDPNATTAPSADRQAVADEIFAIRSERKTA
jgi:chemotaxis regulatin CheY-phosphate phosphatase CheZ